MNYWHMQLHPGKQDWGKEIQLLKQYGLIGLGDWDEAKSQQEQFESVMAIGDIVAIKRGETPIALVEVTGKYEFVSSPGELDWFERRRKVKVLDYYKPAYNYYIAPRGTLTRCAPGNAETNKSIKNWYKSYRSKIFMQEKINLLKFKKQIILQGPPGTGKTKLAKDMAKEMTKSEVTLNPQDYVSWYMKNFRLTGDTLLRERHRQNELSEFKELFPPEEIVNWTLEDYCVGSGNNSGFCYWVEKKLGGYGRFSPGPAGSTVFQVYYSQGAGRYVTRFADETPEQTLDRVKEILSKLIIHGETGPALKYFRKSLVLKILNCYFPDKYFPVYKYEHLLLFAQLFGLDGGGLSDLALNEAVNERFIQLKKANGSDIPSYDLMGHLYEKFRLKEDQPDLNDVKVVDQLGEHKLIQFHPAYAYEDFVRGITAKANDQGQIEYKIENKVLLEFADKALTNPFINYVLIIDEINRANLPSVLGELIYALEYRYDVDNKDDTTVESMYALKNDYLEESQSRTLKLPTNLYIIGTMNSADRSVSHIDYAIRRRFAFVNVKPDIDVLAKVITDADLLLKSQQLFRDVSLLFSKERLTGDFLPEDVQLGHSYFLSQTEADLRLKLDFEIKPLLREYLKDGILRQEPDANGNDLTMLSIDDLKIG